MTVQRTHRTVTRAQSAGGRGTQQRIWEAIRSRRDRFTVAELHSDSLASPGAIASYLFALVRGGYLEQLDTADTGHNTPRVYRLARDNGIEHPRLTAKGEPLVNRVFLATEAIWRTLRAMGDLTLTEIAAFASTPGRPVAYTTVVIYLGHLVKAGYVKRFGSKKANARYQLISYTGPRAPVVGRQLYVYDANEDRVVWREESDDADA